MFRYATISSINCCRNLSTNAARSHIIKYKPKLFESSFNYLVLARCESTSGISNNFNATTLSDLSAGAGIESGKVTASISTEVDPTLLSVTDATGSGSGSVLSLLPNSEAIVDVASSVSDTFSEQLQLIPEAPEIPAQILENVSMPLAANGEPTLASMGLGGWSPSGIVQQALEYLHCDLGLPWWGAIVAGTIVIRLSLFPLVIKSQRQAAKMNNNGPQMQAIQVKMTEARLSGKAFMAAKYAEDLQQFMKEKEINLLKQMTVAVVQGPIFASCYFGYRAMADLPVESMKTGGLFWFTDLTIADPFYALPLITCATLFVTLEIGADGIQLPSSTGGNLFKYALRIIPIVAFLSSVYMDFPAALLCYWVTTNTVSLAQVLLLRIPEVRKKFNIELLQKHAPEDLPVTSKGFKESFKDAWTNMKITKELEELEKMDEIIFKRAGRAPITKTYRYDPTKPPPSTIQAKTKQT